MYPTLVVAVNIADETQFQGHVKEHQLQEQCDQR